MARWLDGKRWMAAGLGFAGTIALLVLWNFYLEVRYPSPFSAYVRDNELEYRIRWLDPVRPETIELRGRLHPVRGLPGGFRILMLGGSTTNGHQITGWENVWPARMEHQFRSMGLDAEVMNAADLGYSCEHILIVAKRLIPLLRPDLVIFMEGWNWPGIAEPLNWSPFPRLPKGLRWLNPAVDSRLFVDFRNRTVRFMGEWGAWHGMISPGEFHRIKREHRYRLARCVRELDDELSALNATHVIVIPPSFLTAEKAAADDLAAYEPMLWIFNYCRTKSLEETVACHLAERQAMRGGLEDALAGTHQWKAVIDGESFAPPEWSTRVRYFMDHMHMTIEGNEQFGRHVAGELMGRGLLPLPSGKDASGGR
ncbi:MAG: SGNH/GDSL hydrolase family protein [Deltaproteobacteria bacterium]|nr:SGNH/GDSL hydrolase family protein [Deltaproteobacteria bacterium]